MNPNQQEYFVYKRLLYGIKQISKSLDGNEVNGMIYESCEAALEKLPDRDRANIEEAIDTLMERMKGTRSFGRKAALELLASVAWCVGGDNGAQ